MEADPVAVGGGDARTFLAPVLEREQAKKGYAGYVLTGGEDAEYAATLVEVLEQPGSLLRG
jgi:hypothetical protein